MSLLDILIDKDNTAPIRLTNENGWSITFEQIAVIPLRDENVMCCILQPIDMKDKGIKEKRYVFRLVPTQDGEDVNLKLEENKKIKKKVLSEYKRLLKLKRR